ncbi:MAG: DUF1508 domain-containing protein, partial [bacterium]
MNYSYYEDEKGQWWWRIHGPDGSVMLDSGGGYTAEQECLDAINKIKGSNNDSDVRKVAFEPPVKPTKTNEAQAAKVTASITTTVDSPTETANPAETIDAATETATPVEISIPLEILTAAEISKTPEAQASVETRTTKEPDTALQAPEAKPVTPSESEIDKKPQAAKEVESETAAGDSKSSVVDVILGESPIASVFTTKDKQLRWTYKANAGVVPVRLLAAIAEFDSIMATIAVSVPKPYRTEAYHQLGKALFAAFHTQQGTKPRTHFRAVRLFVRTKAKERARLVYVIASLAATLLLALIVLPLYFLTINPAIKLITLGGFFGSVGAGISVLQRNPSLDIDPWMSNGYLRLQGITRIALGFIFG